MSLWRRWWFRILCLMLLAIAGVAFNVYWQRRQAAEELRQVLAELDQAELDWRLEQIETKRRVIPDEENGALAALAAYNKLPKNWQSKVQDDLSNTAPPVRCAEEHVKQLREELQAIEPAVLAARKLINYPQGRFAVQYAPDFLSTLMNDQQSARAVANIVLLDALLALHDGQPAKAWPAGKTLLNIGRTYADDPLIISQLIHLAMQALAIQCLERTLAQGSVSDANLAAMHAPLAQERDENLFLIGLRGDRAGMHQLMDHIGKSDTPVAVALENLSATKRREPEWWDFPLDIAARKKVYRSHAWLIRHYTEMIRVAEQAGPAMYSKLAALEQDIDIHDFDRDLIMAKLLVPAVNKIADAERRGDSYLECAIAALAAERFRLKHDRWPNSLEELIDAKLLQKAPEDFYDGKPIRLRRAADGIVFYSVGKDGNYQGDALDRLEDFDPNRLRVEFRLWDPAQRRQPPLPSRKLDEDR